MVEVALTFPLLMILAIAFVEMGILFASYLSLVNAAREGAFFAAACEDLLNPSLDASTSCTNSSQTNLYAYRQRVADEVVNAVGYDLFNGGLQQQDSTCNGSITPNNGVDEFMECLKVDRPVTGPGPTGTNITVTVHYRVHTFTSDISLPGVNRLGLPNYYTIDYSMGVAFLGWNN
jgi:Flp pilus assembly protein TadG